MTIPQYLRRRRLARHSIVGHWKRGELLDSSLSASQDGASLGASQVLSGRGGNSYDEALEIGSAARMRKERAQLAVFGWTQRAWLHLSRRAQGSFSQRKAPLMIRPGAGSSTQALSRLVWVNMIHAPRVAKGCCTVKADIEPIGLVNIIYCSQIPSYESRNME